MAPTLYMTDISPSSRAVLMICNALGIKINKHYVDITSGEHLTPEFIKMNPQHTVPTFVDDDGKVIWDGHAIIFYLVTKYGKNEFYPDDPFTRALIQQRLHFDVEYLFPAISKITRDLFNGATRMDPNLLDKIKQAYDILERMLEGRIWAVGDQLTIADFCMLATTTTMDLALPIDPKIYPNIITWLKRGQNLPYYKENVVGWCITKKVKKTSEDVLLAYMAEANKKYKSSTLWSVYSMLRSMLLVKENVNISKFSKLEAYLKRASVGYQAKKSRVFSRNEVDDFLLKASDDTYLMMKVALIVGLAGACRCDELAKMTLDDIDDKGNVLMMTIPYSKTYKARRFIVIDGNQQINLSLYRKYLALRPAHTPHRRLFVNYKKGKCSVQAVGIHTIGTIPSKVAAFLGLPNCTEYTGHCLRRTSATLLVDARGDISDLKRHGGWVSSGVAEGYIAESTENKRETARKIQGGMLCERSNKTADHNELSISGDAITGTEENTVAISSSTKAALSGINVSNVQNTNININIYN